jgi:hypothetical protein
MEYHQEGSPEKKKSKPKLRQENSWLQFFRMQMMLFTVFLEPGTPINSKHYIATLRTLKE